MSSLLLLAAVAPPSFAPTMSVSRLTTAAKSPRSFVVALGADEADGEARRGNAGAELQIDEDSRGLGIAVLGISAITLPFLAFAVATALGMGIGSADNDGLGVPLSTEESRALKAKAGTVTSAEDEDRRIAQGLTAEEAREEEALVKILRSEPLRSR